MNKNGSFEFLSGIVMGGIVGMGIALLMAPASGEKTRGEIRARGSHLKNRGEALSNQAKGQVQKATKEGQQRLSDAQERAGAAVDEQKARVVEAIDAGKQAASQRRGQLLNRFESDKATHAAPHG